MQLRAISHSFAIFGKMNCNSHNTDAGINAEKTKLGLDLKKRLLKQSKVHLTWAQWPTKDASERLLVKNKTIRVLLNTGLSGDLLFMEKGSAKCILVARRAVPESWSTSNGFFMTPKMGNIELSFVEYSLAS